jgi:PIN domain nuclease of toxin-antitoxin system
MRVLLDTHAFLWWSVADAPLGRRAARAIRDPETTVLLSAASAWEIATKHRLGKLPEAQTILDDLPDALERGRIETLSISVAHALAAGALHGPHRDPFDRVLIAQSRIEGIPVVTSDPVFKAYRVKVIW